MEGRATADLALDPDPPAMLIDDIAADIEPETQAADGAARCIGSPEIALKSSRRCSSGMPIPWILDAQLRHAVDYFHAYPMIVSGALYFDALSSRPAITCSSLPGSPWTITGSSGSLV